MWQSKNEPSSLGDQFLMVHVMSAHKNMNAAQSNGTISSKEALQIKLVLKRTKQNKKSNQV